MHSPSSLSRMMFNLEMPNMLNVKMTKYHFENIFLLKMMGNDISLEMELFNHLCEQHNPTNAVVWRR